MFLKHHFFYCFLSLIFLIHKSMCLYKLKYTSLGLWIVYITMFMSLVAFLLFLDMQPVSHSFFKRKVMRFDILTYKTVPYLKSVGFSKSRKFNFIGSIPACLLQTCIQFVCVTSRSVEFQYCDFSFHLKFLFCLSSGASDTELV